MRTRCVGARRTAGDYDAFAVNYATDSACAGSSAADDNWLDGTQSLVFNFVSLGVVEAGYGLTTTRSTSTATTSG